jgi:hypothetical protein
MKVAAREGAHGPDQMGSKRPPQLREGSKGTSSCSAGNVGEFTQFTQTISNSVEKKEKITCGQCLKSQAGQHHQAVVLAFLCVFPSENYLGTTQSLLSNCCPGRMMGGRVPGGTIARGGVLSMERNGEFC